MVGSLKRNFRLLIIQTKISIVGQGSPEPSADNHRSLAVIEFYKVYGALLEIGVRKAYPLIEI